MRIGTAGGATLEAADEPATGGAGGTVSRAAGAPASVAADMAGVPAGAATGATADPPANAATRPPIGSANAGRLAAGTSWYEASARQRLAGLVDTGTFSEFVGPRERMTSPHLPLFELPGQFDDGMIVGRARLAGQPMLVAAQEGRFMGGAFGEVHGAKLTGLLRAARDVRQPVVILFDTGGVRLQEANAGEIAVSEIIRAMLDARAVGVSVVGLVGGRAGCYGGGGIIAACCSALAVSEAGRIGVSGPEVIESRHGVDEFDSRDRALVWRTMGGKHRRLSGGAERFVDDTIDAFRHAAIELVAQTSAVAFDIATLEAEHARLAKRIERFRGCHDALDMWHALGASDAASIPALDYPAFTALADRLSEVSDGAR
ncbi:biotin-independent malonate decarboxylase subunit beta [Burkholderia singularis]|uniref:Malonate decarboxylase beta subunit n=1 Tax=Burkholderia singularis TaxID=1503053 RepID=A0A238H2Q5_9BURK|nr:biotin-independent malonate decarboxylase subunit beta [Burkholderia singularis]SMF99514.1 Malonate decarboxylase beta subunit [Burkholderia singularis]